MLQVGLLPAWDFQVLQVSIQLPQVQRRLHLRKLHTQVTPQQLHSLRKQERLSLQVLSLLPNRLLVNKKSRSAKLLLLPNRLSDMKQLLLLTLTML